jgi:hypothetical protein
MRHEVVGSSGTFHDPRFTAIHGHIDAILRVGITRKSSAGRLVFERWSHHCFDLANPQRLEY